MSKLKGDKTGKAGNGGGFADGLFHKPLDGFVFEMNSRCGVNFDSHAVEEVGLCDLQRERGGREIQRDIQ